MGKGLAEKLSGLIWDKPVTEQDAPAATPTAHVNVYSASVAQDPDMVSSIRKATLARKTPYTALLEAAEKLVNVIPDQATRLKAAFAMVGTESRSVAQIGKSLDMHVQDAEGEKLRFFQATAAKRESQVGDLKRKIVSLQTTNTNLQAEIASLQERMAKLTGDVSRNTVDISAASTEADAKESDIVKVEKQFEGAVQFVKDELEQQRRLILSTLA